VDTPRAIGNCMGGDMVTGVLSVVSVHRAGSRHGWSFAVVKVYAAIGALPCGTANVSVVPAVNRTAHLEAVLLSIAEAAPCCE
jgi:hypothetical protein